MKCDTPYIGRLLLCLVSSMLNVAINPFRLSVIMLSVIMLSVVMPSVVAPSTEPNVAQLVSLSVVFVLRQCKLPFIC
jgi:hypothetical protein